MKRTPLTVTTLAALFIGMNIAPSLTSSAEFQGPQGPPVQNQPGRRLKSLTLSKPFVTGSADFTGSVRLEFVAPNAGTRVNLTTDPLPGIEGENLAVVPSGVTVREGSATATFQIKTNPVQSARQVKVIANAGGVTKTASFSLQPLLATLVIVPQAGFGPFQATGTVTLNAPAPPNTIVPLTSSNPDVVRFGNVGGSQATRSLPIQTSQSLGTFQLFARPVTEITTVTIRATVNGTTLSRPVTVRPLPYELQSPSAGRRCRSTAATS